MSNSHDNQRPWRDRLLDRVLNLVGTKFLLGLIGLGVSTWMIYINKLDGGNFAMIVVGLAGAHSVANSINTVAHARYNPPRPTTQQTTTITMEKPDDVAPTDPESIEDDGVYP